MKIATVLFREALQSVYGPLDWGPVGDGEIHRFHVPGDKPGRLNGWYVLFTDTIAAGAFGSWKEGKTHTWCSRQPQDHQEARQVREHMEQARRRRDTERLRCQYQAAELALCWWRKAPCADPKHAYLVAKQIDPYTLRQRNDELLVPLYANGQLVSLQRIGPDGSKRFLRGGKVQSSYSILGTVTPEQPLCICEGWATAATLYQSGYTAAAAMNAGNLKPVALALKARYPDVPLIIAGDDEWPRVHNRAGYWELLDERRLYLFNKPALIEAANGYGLGRIVKALEGLGGLARRDSDRKRHTKTYLLPGGGFAGLYVVDPEVIDTDNA